MTNNPGTPPHTPPAKRRTWRVLDLLRWGEEYFQGQGIGNARLEVEWLLAHVLELQRVDLYVQFDRPLTLEELAHFKGYIKRRVDGEPFQYILGRASFYGRDFKVNPAVMIPRPETEVLIQVLRRGPAPESILDIGTGSGCLAVTAGLLYPTAQVLAVDISPEALAVAAENTRELGAGNVTFQRLDILKVSLEEAFDAVLCNPPYVAAGEMPALQREIREHEPGAALSNGANGLTFHHRLAEIGPLLLNPSGRLLMELGRSVREGPSREIFTRAGAEIQVHADLQGDPRVVEVIWPE